MIKNHFKNQDEISILEPSVGIGNFIYAANGLAEKSKITGFEINEITAKIAKVLHPEAEINLRSFETKFIDEKGNKKSSTVFSGKYDLVIGNPPYGEHRGLYKGLGEESKISKFEDYFVKRGIDSLKDDGILAMVFPSGWINRQKKMQNADLVNAYRLPSGVFSGTQVGVDIIILKKSARNISHDVSSYFEQNAQNILGEIQEKTNRFGRVEHYVYGSLNEAIYLLENLQNKKEIFRIGNLFDDLLIEEVSSKNAVSTDVTSISKKEKENQLNVEDRNEFSLETAQDKIKEVLLKLNEIKFKSPSILSEIRKYSKLQT